MPVSAEIVEEQEPPDGLNLQEAIERHSNPAAWRAYLQAESAAWGRREVRYISGDDPATFARAAESNRLVRALERTRAAVVREFCLKLHRGELVATCLETPVGREGRRERLPPGLWEVLVPEFRASCATAPGSKFIAIRVFTKQQWATWEGSRTVSPTGPAPLEPAAAPDIPLPPRKRAGRPGLSPAIESNLRRRAAAGDLSDSWIEESQALCEWYHRTFPGERRVTAKGIRERLRPVYLELKAAKSRRK